MKPMTNKMQMDANLSNQMIESIPFGIYIVDRNMEISYYNQAFADVFSTGVHKTLPYFGDLVNCGYCVAGKADNESAQCSNCLIIRQHNQVFESGEITKPQDIVQEFLINGVKRLMYFQIQSIPLDENRLMVIIKDLTQEAKKLVVSEN